MEEHEQCGYSRKRQNERCNSSDRCERKQWSMRNMCLLCKVGREVYSSLEYIQIQPQNTLPSHTIVLALSNDRMPEWKKGSFSALDILKRPP